MGWWDWIDCRKGMGGVRTGCGGYQKPQKFGIPGPIFLSLYCKCNMGVTLNEVKF